MARRNSSPSAGVSERVEQAIARGGQLRLWLVFESDEDAVAARALISARKAKHLEALSRAQWQAREAEAWARVAARAAGRTLEPLPVEAPPAPARRRKAA